MTPKTEVIYNGQRFEVLDSYIGFLLAQASCYPEMLKPLDNRKGDTHDREDLPLPFDLSVHES